MRRILAFLMAFALLLGSAHSLALELLSAGDIYPIDTDKAITLYAQGLLPASGSSAGYTGSPFYTGLSEETGIDIEWMFPPEGATGSEATAAMWSDRANLPNIMITDWLPDAKGYIDDRLIWDITPYLQEYAPAYYAFLQSNPEYDRAFKTDDGRYYSFGSFYNDGGWSQTYTGPVIRTDWLEACNLEIPTTVSEFEHVIRTFYEKYGAQFTFSFIRFRNAGGLAGAFGAYGAEEPTYFIQNGKVGLAQTRKEWRAYVSWLNALYEEGLIDQAFNHRDDVSVRESVHNDLCGISVTAAVQMDNWNKERMAEGKEAVWQAIPYPTADDGSIAMVPGGAGYRQYSCVITRNTDVETMKLCLRLLDYAYTREGFLYWNYGKEGVSWEYGQDGMPQWTSLLTNEADDLSRLKLRLQYTGSWYGPCIGDEHITTIENSESVVEAMKVWFYSHEGAVNGGRFPSSATYTIEESDELALIGEKAFELHTIDENNKPVLIGEQTAYESFRAYSIQRFIEFIKGALDIDDDVIWLRYLMIYGRAYDLDRLLEIRQDCYDRYIAR